MAEVKPFRAVRYGEAAQPPVVAPPYDVISPEERARYLAASPHNVVHLTLPDNEARAARLFSDWLAEGVLVREPEPALWWLEQEFVGPDGVRRTREGLVGSLRLEPYEAGVVLPHERTHRGPKEGRLRLLRATHVQLEPIFLLYEHASDLRPELAPEPDFQAELEGVDARLWRLADAATIERIAGELAERRLLIADGHHRYETALAFHAEDGSAESAYTLAVLVNSRGGGLAIFPTHRIAGRLPKLDGDLRVTPVSGGPQEALRLLEGLTREHPAFVLYRGGSAALVEAPADTALDTALVDRLAPGDVSYTPRLDEAVAAVDSGRAEGAFLVRAPLIDDVAAVAEAGETMPQKSTYFYPKLASGLLFHPLA